ncbi:hypothetical protein B0T16DRAFT_486713 [Cercophora newfieldiana]|uniref:GATA-type domain-containing protein n=1 Tax=Cercophora newfieldiana TaxID=92897 RepID=A0AA39YPU0_9PEZI|nr:hypothetical protein B0T16DRAFT_486713 [Cercophora newfieldiana]
MSNRSSRRTLSPPIEPPAAQRSPGVVPLPSFQEFTESLTSDEEDTFGPQAQLPVPVFPSRLPSPSTPGDGSESSQRVGPSIASFVPPARPEAGGPLPARAPPIIHLGHHQDHQRLHPMQAPSAPAEFAPRLEGSPVIVDERPPINTPINAPINDDETIMPPEIWGNLEGIITAARSLYTFGLGLKEQHCRYAPGPYGTTVTVALLPSSKMVQMQLQSAFALKKKLREFEHLVRWEEAKAAPNANTGEVTAPPSSGLKPGGTAVGAAVGSEDAKNGGGVVDGGVEAGDASASTSSPRPKKKKRKTVSEPRPKNTIPARNPAGCCYNCGSVESTEWRRGPEGQRTLCNPCGIRYVKDKGPVQLVVPRINAWMPIEVSDVPVPAGRAASASGGRNGLRVWEFV